MITVRPLEAGEGKPLGPVRLREMPAIFGGTTKGAERVWLQYVRGDLSMVHRTYYVALLQWEGRVVHQLETEYYEPEFPEARLWMQVWIEETEEAWRTVMWGQRYPDSTAELRRENGVQPRLLRPGASEPLSVDPQTYLLDSCGQFQARCLRFWSVGDDAFSPLQEFFVDGDGYCLYGRRWGPAGDRPEEDALTLERGGERFVLLWEQLPNRLVRAIW